MTIPSDDIVRGDLIAPILSPPAGNQALFSVALVLPLAFRRELIARSGTPLGSWRLVPVHMNIVLVDHVLP